MTPTRRTAKWALAALAALAIQACGTEPAGPAGALDGARAGRAADAYGTLEELEANRERWEAARVSDYAYTIAKLCFCAPESALVEVRDGETARVTPLEGPFEGRTEAFDSLDNFRELFDRVQAAVESRPDGLKVAYDREWGYPVYLHVDPSWAVADDEHGFKVESFEPRW